MNPQELRGDEMSKDFYSGDKVPYLGSYIQPAACQFFNVVINILKHKVT